MRLLTDLFERQPTVWIYCEDEKLQKLFLLQAESEGFRALNGDKPTKLSLRKYYGINDDMTMGYLAGMIWCMTKKNKQDQHDRVDYGKYISGKGARMDKHDIREWKMLFDAKGVLRYEGMTVNGEPFGAGTLYYSNGKIYQEGVFGKKGLLCGTEYYSNGNKRFSGMYKYNGGYGPNYPQYGSFYKRNGRISYEGEIKVRRSGLGWPTVEYPVEFGSVIQRGAPNMELFDFQIEIDDGTNN